MSGKGFEIEPDRYELAAGPLYQFGLSRRDLFRTVSGGILVLVTLPALGATPQESGGGQRRGGGSQPQEIGGWLQIGEDGSIVAYTGKVEVGQNARTALTQAVAEELRVAPTDVHLVMGDTDLTPYDMGTFGSRTTPTMSPLMRKAAAAARELLLGLAAEKLSVERGALTVANGKVVQSETGRAIGFGELTNGQKLTAAVSDTVTLTPTDQWQILGQSLSKVNGRDMVTGRHQYTSDKTLPGMLFGRILRTPAYGATLATLDTTKAEALTGVRVIRDGDFVGVVAPSRAEADAAIEALRATWNHLPGSPPETKGLFALLKSTGKESEDNFTVGSIPDGLAKAKVTRTGTYTVSYIAHTPLEPRAALAEWSEDKLTVWTGTQRPFGVRQELAAAFHMPEEKVRVLVPDTGSGYGGKHTGECAIEAARLAKTAGKPVKLIWTRPEEFTWAYFRPAGVIEVTAGVTADAQLTAWEFHNYNSGTAAIRSTYEIPNQKVVFHPSDSPLRQGSYRGLAATANHFARETHIDEMAQSIGADPLAFRLQNLKDSRQRAVLEAVATAFAWGKSHPATNHGFGIACGFDKGGYVATCAEVSVDKANGGKVRIERVMTAFECGAIVNPEQLKNQVEGAMIQGIGGALYEAIDFGEGHVRNPYFSMYRLPRFRDVPPIITTILLNRKDLPSAGAGESPIVGIAPALGNALFAATGVRLRGLPLLPEGRFIG
jgi:isoquinoline 1-oxidoreductase